MTWSGYDREHPANWEWRAEYREASAEHGDEGEWQINAYAGRGNSPCWLASAWPLERGDGAVCAHLMAAAPALYRALAFAKTVIVCQEPWSERCAEVIDGALQKAQGGLP